MGIRYIVSQFSRHYMTTKICRLETKPGSYLWNNCAVMQESSSLSSYILGNHHKAEKDNRWSKRRKTDSLIAKSRTKCCGCVPEQEIHSVLFCFFTFPAKDIKSGWKISFMTVFLSLHMNTEILLVFLFENNLKFLQDFKTQIPMLIDVFLFSRHCFERPPPGSDFYALPLPWGALRQRGLSLPSLKSDVHSTCWFFKQLCPQKKKKSGQAAHPQL